MSVQPPKPARSVGKVVGIVIIGVVAFFIWSEFNTGNTTGHHTGGSITISAGDVADAMGPSFQTRFCTALNTPGMTYSMGETAFANSYGYHSDGPSDRNRTRFFSTIGSP